MHKNLIDLTGKVFGRLTVTRRAELGVVSQAHWYVTCECSPLELPTPYPGSKLRAGIRTSCGCEKEVGGCSWRQKFNTYRCGAKEKEIPFLLSFTEFKNIASRNCTYCGAFPRDFNTYKKKNGSSISRRLNVATVDRQNITANGIDRIDNEVGYIVDNCASCCTTCNKMKLEMRVEVWIDHMRAILKHMGKC